MDPIKLANLFYKNSDQIPKTSGYITWFVSFRPEIKKVLDFVRDKKRLGDKLQSLCRDRVEEMVRKFAALGEGARSGTKTDTFDLAGISNKIFEDIFKFDDESSKDYIQVKEDTMLGMWYSHSQAIKSSSNEEQLKVFKKCLQKICEKESFLTQLQGYFEKYGQECFILYCGVIQEQFSEEFIDEKCDYSFLLKILIKM